MDGNYSLSDMAAVSRGGDGFGNGNGLWIFALLLLLFGGNGWGGNKNDAATNADVQRAVDLSSIQGGQAALGADIQRAIYEINGNTNHVAYDNLGEIRDVGAAVSASGANIINNLTAMQAQMQNCCCETKSMILENRYLDAQNTAAINANTTAQTQKIMDAIAQDKIATLQNQVNQLQMQQAVCGMPKISPYMYNITPNCGCGNI